MRDLLSAARVAIVRDASDGADVIDAAAQLLADPAQPGQASVIAASLHARETLASTAIGHGVAIPHARIATLDASRGAFLRVSPPVPFGASDNAPVDLVLALAVPEHHVQQHLHRLAELAEYFADADFRARLREADDLEALRMLLLESEAPTP
ncbi:PTS fructose transporter subunit IIA [Lysobacter bugurensis]|uniref:PTS fructose transporter subunit IIA n=2 Tax=Cognatilysobacter bugurensis TaxID=543356 RepID=A0A918W8T2_9GAMM|nr:PTS fructose transporter subunit IIA [Lysobacter bugurensis]